MSRRLFVFCERSFAALSKNATTLTILAALGLDPTALDAVQQEGTDVLPGLDLDCDGR